MALDKGSREAVGIWGAVLGLGLVPSIYRVVALRYHAFELWRHSLLDVLFVVLCAVVLGWNPLKIRAVYGGLFLAFCASYLHTNWPSGVAEWFGTIVVLGMLGGYIFPRLHHLTAYVTIGLVLAYVGVLRMYLPSLNRDEVRAVLSQQSPKKTAASFYMALGNFQRPVIAAETFRYYLANGEGYHGRHSKASAAVARLRADLERSGIAFVRFDEARVLEPQTTAKGRLRVTLPAQELPCVLEARGESEAGGRCTARISQVSAELVAGDGGYLVSDFDDVVQVTRAR